ncbi:MAG: NAD(P)H-hydrate epimerase, partial [Gemmatimonadota bacterium]
MSDLFGIEWVPLPTAAEMAALDRAARESAGVPERALMEAAGRAVAAVVHSLVPRGRIVAAVGSGNNGGDARIAARALAAWGRDARIVEAKAGGASEVGHGWRLPVVPLEEAAVTFASAEVLIDGLLGTGSQGAPRGAVAGLIEAMNASARPIVAVDGPSGIDFTTGEVKGACVRAAVTVALGYPKRGCLFQPGRDRCGRLLAAEIGFPPVEPTAVSAQVITPAWTRARLPTRAPDAHKGSAGYLLVAAGASGMAGAAALVARAALRAGVGLVRVLSDAANREILQSLVPEAIFIDAEEEEAVAESGDWAHAVVAGPGLGRSAAARRRL